MAANTIFSLLVSKDELDIHLYKVQKNPASIIYSIEPHKVNDKGEPLYRIEVPIYKMEGDRESIKQIISNLIDSFFDEIEKLN